MKRQLFQLANALRGQGLPRSEAFARAWAVMRLKEAMSRQPVHFAYIKDDGSRREAFGWLGQDNTPAQPAKPCPVLVVRYRDVQAGGVRSFRADRLITSTFVKPNS